MVLTLRGGIGITLTLFGGAWYSRIELLQSNRSRQEEKATVLPVHKINPEKFNAAEKR